MEQSESSQIPQGCGDREIRDGGSVGTNIGRIEGRFLD